MVDSPIRPTITRSIGARSGRRSLLVALLFSFVGLSVATSPVSAGISWCRSDPVVLFSVEDGGLLGSAVLADIFVSAPLPILFNVTGPNQVVVTTPPGVRAVLAISDLGFGRGEIVTFQQSDALTKSNTGFQVEVAVYVPARKDMAVEVHVAPRVLGLLWPATNRGRTNQWIVFRTTI